MTSKSLSERRFQFTLRTLFLCVTAFAVVCSFCASVKSLEDHRAEHRCSSRLKRIYSRIGLFYYGDIPPAKLCNQAGKPVQSWRSMVAIVGAFCEGHRCPISFAGSWNDRSNSYWETQLADEYQCSAENYRTLETSYVAVVGQDTMWPGTDCVRIPEGIQSDTILIIEVPEARIRWMEPRDVTLEELWRLIKSPSGNGITCTHPSGRPYLAIDGTVHYLPPTTDCATLKRLVQRDPRCQLVPCDHQKFVRWLNERWAADKPLPFVDWCRELTVP
jgi:hypothetical protein